MAWLRIQNRVGIVIPLREVCTSNSREQEAAPAVPAEGRTPPEGHRLSGRQFGRGTGEKIRKEGSRPGTGGERVRFLFAAPPPVPAPPRVTNR